MSGASPQACPVAALRPGRFPSHRPFSARGSHPETPRRSPETPPSLRPGCSLLPESARGRPLTSSRRSLCTRAAWTCWAQFPGAEGSCEDSLPLRRPGWGDAEPFFLFFAWSRGSASKVKSLRPQIRTSASPEDVMGMRARREGWPRRSPHLFFLPPPRGALGPSRVPTLAAVASWQVTWSWPRGAWTAPPEPMWSPFQGCSRPPPVVLHLWQCGGSIKLLICCKNSLLGLYALCISQPV